MKKLLLLALCLPVFLISCEVAYTDTPMPNSGSYVSSIPYFLQGTHYDFEFEHKVVVTSSTVKMYADNGSLSFSFTVGEDLIIKKYGGYYCFNFKHYDYGKSRYVQAFIKDNSSVDEFEVYVVGLPYDLGEYDEFGDFGFTFLGSGDGLLEDYYELKMSESEYLSYVFEDETMIWQTALGSKAAMEEYQASSDDFWSDLGGTEEESSSTTSSDILCLAGDCYDGYGMKQYSGGDIYCGFFKNGKRHYYGAYFWEEGGFYLGTWFENSYSEFKHGLEAYPDGDLRYRTDARDASDWGESGCVSGDCDDGWGVYIFSDGDMHVGNFKDQQSHLMGLHFWESGDFWMGMYDDGDRTTHRHGLYVWEDKTYKIYNDPISPYGTGCLAGDCNDGFGTYRWENGDIHCGFWTGIEQDFFSFKFWDDGDFFLGMYEDGDRLNRGFYVYETGNYDVRTDKVKY